MTRTLHHTPNYDPERQGKGNFVPAYHLEMISDKERVSRLKKGIDHMVDKDTLFCELGCGTGIFSIHAARKAKKVFAVEYDPCILEFARRNIEQSGLSHKIQLIYGDCKQLELPEKVSVVFCEMLSTWMIEEPQVPVMNYAVKRLLKEGGSTIPQKVINLVELCHTDFVFDGIRLKTSIAQFTGITAPRVMTESKVFSSFYLNRENPVSIGGSIPFEILTPGVVNSVRLSSIVTIAGDVHFYTSDTLMPLTIVPLQGEHRVKEGEQIILQADYMHKGGLDNAVFQINRRT